MSKGLGRAHEDGQKVLFQAKKLVGFEFELKIEDPGSSIKSLKKGWLPIATSHNPISRLTTDCAV